MRANIQAQSGPEQVLYAFQGGNDGENPFGNLVFDSSGNLYGTTQYGGTGTCGVAPAPTGCGTAFELSPNSSGGWIETILYAFQGGADGDSPNPLIFDASGNLYGTTQQGGEGGAGTVFELVHNSSGGWTKTTLYSFSGTVSAGQSSDGAIPLGSLTFDKSGNLYGTTEYGGILGCGFDNGELTCGTAFELTPGSSGWAETVIYSFPEDTYGAGWSPSGGLTFDQSGNLYGATSLGGVHTESSECNGGCGLVFELSPGDSGWTETVLYEFQGAVTADGYDPDGGLIFDQAGNLYGATYGGGAGTGCTNDFGGPAGCGTVFELIPNGSGGWPENILYTFQGGASDGAHPPGSVIFDQSGNLYGLTEFGGFSGCYGDLTNVCGTVFELSPNGINGWTESILYEFQGGTDGSVPVGGVIFDQAGNLYGATSEGGGSTNCGSTYPGCGTVFEVSKEPFVAFSPANYSFGNQTVAIPSGAQGLTLTNSGNLPLTVTSIHISGANSSDFIESNNCPSTLTAFASCTIYVTFTPALAGNRSASISVSDDAPGSPQALPLTGVGVLPALSISPANLNFGNQTAGIVGGPQTITLSNTGAGTLTVTSIAITGTNSNEFSQNNNCSSPVAPNSSCAINVTFAPNALGNANASLSVIDNAPDSPQSASLTGVGISGVGLSPSSVTFPSQYVGTTGLPQTVTLTNSADTPLTISNVSASPSDFAATSGCGSILAAGQSCSIGVFFDPTTSGTRTGVLTVTDSAANSPETVALSGTGQDFSMTSSGSSSATVSPGQTANYTISLAPGGGFSQTVTLTCAGAPASSACSISPASVKLAGSSSTVVTVAVTTAGSSASLMHQGSFSRGRLALWLTISGLPGLVLLGGCRRKRVQVFRVLAVLSLFAVATTWFACGSGSSSGSGAGAGSTPAGTYNLTVTGTFTSGATTLTRNSNLTLIVQ